MHISTYQLIQDYRKDKNRLIKAKKRGIPIDEKAEKDLERKLDVILRRIKHRGTMGSYSQGYEDKDAELKSKFPKEI